MIRTVLEYQRYVLAHLLDFICEIFHGQHRSQYEVRKRGKDQQRLLGMHMKDIDRMDKQASRIHRFITDLPDLKQKQANTFEARFAHDHAAGTTRQMVFIIVTIIFLSLSIIASIFTIHMKEFENLNLAYVARYTFGVGFAISISLTLLTLSVEDVEDIEDIGDFLRSIWRCVSL